MSFKITVKTNVLFAFFFSKEFIILALKKGGNLWTDVYESLRNMDMFSRI